MIRGLVGAYRLIVRNWPLKLGALALSTLLYSGLVLSQTTRDFAGSVPIVPVNQSPQLMILSPLGVVTDIRYVASDPGLRIDSQTFSATVDLTRVDPSSGHVTVPVSVVSLDDRVQVLDFQPQQITIQLDSKASKTVPIKAVVSGPIPSGLAIGNAVVDQASATVTGPASVISQIAEADALVVVDNSGIDVNQTIDLVAVDAQGNQVTSDAMEIDPRSVLVKLPVFTDRKTRTVPVSPVVVGTPAAGFEVASVTVQPLVVQVEGDANDLSSLNEADTAPVSVSGASSTVVEKVDLALPDGIQPLGDGTVQVTIVLRPVTSTRTFDAGLILVGASPDKTYTLSTGHVLVTIGGSEADLDRLQGGTLVLNLDVTGLDDGDHRIVPTANLTTGLTLLGISPSPVVVTISTPTPSPS
ncbi:MAG TPA: CdaR family protein [Candidatus Limnocylindrales bacterium]|nr:CdaR family protein [Candidatus Limnocylindrales bacterium]